MGDECLKVDVASASKAVGRLRVGANEANPFSSLKIWRSKVQTDLVELPQTRDFKLRLLLEQAKDCEQAVWGCLKDALHELAEAHAWGLIGTEEASTERERLYGQAAQEISNDKHLILELAREAELLDDYRHEFVWPINHAVADYDSLGQMRFGMLTWRANMHILLSFATTKEDMKAELAEGYESAMRMIHRCIEASKSFWTQQGGTAACCKASQDAVLRNAQSKLTRALEEVASSHHIDEAEVTSIVAAVPLERIAQLSAKEAGEEDSPGEDRYVIER